MATRTLRLVYGLHPETGEKLYWTLKIKNATKAVNLQGHLQHAIEGAPGGGIGCYISLAGQDKENRAAWAHPVKYVCVRKNTAIAITKITRGQPSHGVRYRHSLGKLVDLNDCSSKRKIRELGELFERTIRLLPYKSEKAHWRPEYGRKETGERTFKLPRGELARMKKAGLIRLEI